MNFEFGNNKKWKGVGNLGWKVNVGKSEGKFSLCLKTDNFHGIDGKYCIKVISFRGKFRKCRCGKCLGEVRERTEEVWYWEVGGRREGAGPRGELEDHKGFLFGSWLGGW